MKNLTKILIQRFIKYYEGAGHAFGGVFSIFRSDDFNMIINLIFILKSFLSLDYIK
jgi:hypothetical protein